jgi:hypothetical protein
MITERSRCTVDILSQILYYKTKDVGKTSGLLIIDNILYC